MKFTVSAPLPSGGVLRPCAMWGLPLRSGSRVFRPHRASVGPGKSDVARTGPGPKWVVACDSPGSSIHLHPSITCQTDQDPASKDDPLDFPEGQGSAIVKVKVSVLGFGWACRQD